MFFGFFRYLFSVHFLYKIMNMNDVTTQVFSNKAV